MPLLTSTRRSRVVGGGDGRVCVHSIVLLHFIYCIRTFGYLRGTGTNSPENRKDSYIRMCVHVCQCVGDRMSLGERKIPHLPLSLMMSLAPLGASLSRVCCKIQGCGQKAQCSESPPQSRNAFPPKMQNAPPRWEEAKKVIGIIFPKISE